MCLDELLSKHFGSKKNFLSRKRVVGHWSDGEPDYEYMTRSGGKAYEKLTALMYGLEELLGSDFDANKHITEMDAIISGEQY